MKAVEIKNECQVLDSSTLYSVSGPFGYGGGDSGTARAREFEWEDDWED